MFLRWFQITSDWPIRFLPFFRRFRKIFFSSNSYTSVEVFNQLVSIKPLRVSIALKINRGQAIKHFGKLRKLCIGQEALVYKSEILKNLGQFYFILKRKQTNKFQYKWINRLACKFWTTKENFTKYHLFDHFLEDFNSWNDFKQLSQLINRFT